MAKRIDADPWDELPSEDLAIGGVQVHVRGLTIRELSDATKPCKGNPEAIAEALVVACVSRADGKEVTADRVGRYPPGVFKALSEAVARVNGFTAGNSSATGVDDSSTA